MTRARIPSGRQCAVDGPKDDNATVERTWPTAADLVAAAEGAIEYRRPIDRGTRGVHEVTFSATSSAAIAKAWPDDVMSREQLRRCVEVAADLRSRGWPLPTVLAWSVQDGVAYIIESLEPGTPPDQVTEETASELVGLVRRAEGAGHAEGHSWRRWLRDNLTHGAADGPIRPATLAAHPVGEHWLRIARERYEEAEPGLRGRDLIHSDLDPGNILVRDGRLTAIVDWHGCREGDAAFDLAGLAWGLNSAAPATRAVVERSLEQHPEDVVAFVRSFYALWNLSWAISTDDEQPVIEQAAAFGARP